MTALGTFFIGAVLFINGLSLLGLIDARGAVPINAFVGLLLIGESADIAVRLDDLDAGAQRDLALSATGCVLFAFTYLWVAYNNWSGAPGRGLGWYCLWAAGVSAGLAAINFVRFEDARGGVLWLMWTL